MIQHIRKWTALLLTLALTLALVPARAQAARGNSSGETGIQAFSKEETLHILAIGNSFSVDGLHYLYQMAESAGYDVVIGELYFSSCTLQYHWNNLDVGMEVYTYYKISDASNGAWATTKNASIAQVLQDEQWDVITLQQSSGLAGVPGSYYQNSWTCDILGAGSQSTLPAVTAEAEEEQTEPESEETLSGEEPEAAEEAPDLEQPEDTEEDVGEEEPDPAPQQKQRQSIFCGVERSGSSASFSLNATAETELSYQSSNPNVAQVDENGTVTLTGSGVAKVTITAAGTDAYYGAETQVKVTSSRTSYLKLLVNEIRAQYRTKWGATAARALQFGWQMTWAYAKTNVNSSFRSSYQTYYGGDQDTMYQAIADTVQDEVVNSKLFSFYVPTGTAIQNARTSYAGDQLNRDGVHLSYGLGRYIAAMTWASTLGIDVNEISYLPTGTYAVSPLDLDMIRASVTDVLQRPWTVSASAYSTTPVLKATALKTPANLSTGLRLTWSKVSNATGYRIYRKSSGSYSLIKTITNGSTVTYTDTAVKSKTGTTYTYYVQAYSGELIAAAASNTVKQTRLTAPSKVSVSNTSSGVKVTWSKVTGATSYRIYRKASGGTRTCIKTVASGSTVTYTDTAVKSKNGTTYTYDVVPYTKLGAGVTSSTKTVVRLTGVTAKSLKKSGSALKLTWSRNSKATGYYIYRRTGSGSWSKVKTIKKNSTLTYTDKTVKKGKTYSYRIYAYKGSSTSAVSNTKKLKR